jgi:anaerobic selenocysteine-containing dehydrogenase
LPLFRQGYTAEQSGEALDPLPDYIPPKESPATNPMLAKRYPLNMLSPKSHAFLNSSYGNLPVQQHHAGAQKVIINPRDASLRGIAAGDLVRVFNDRGAFQALAELSLDTMTGIVVAPMGYWPRDSRPRRSVNAINPPAFADYGNAPTFSDTLVEVAKVVAAAA